MYIGRTYYIGSVALWWNDVTLIRRIAPAGKENPRKISRGRGLPDAVGRGEKNGVSGLSACRAG